MPDLSDLSRSQEIRRGQARAGCFQPKTGKALEDDTCEAIPVADEVGEDADEQGLLDEARDDVLVRPPDSRIAPRA